MVSDCLAVNVVTSSVNYAQELYVASDAEVTIKPSTYVYAGSDVSIVGTGILTAESDATSSSSFIADASVTGDVTYKRYVVGGADSGTVGTSWHLVSAPVGEQDIATFGADAANEVSTSGNKYAIAYYKNDNLPTKKWEYYTTASTEDFVRGQGYSTHRGSSGVYTFKGTMDTAPVGVTLTPASIDHPWFSVGNPFPSFLSTTAVYADNTAILDVTTYNALYVWVGASYVAKNNSSTGELLPPGQAFLIKSKDANSQTFTFNETSQTTQVGATDLFERTAAVPSVVVNLTSGTESAKTTLKYFSNTTKGLDVGWDAGSFYNGTKSFSIDTHLVNDSEGINITLQCLPTAAYETTVVSLAVNAAAGQTINFNALAENLPTGINVYLEDKINNTYQNINDASYTVTLTNAVNGIGNFFLHTSSSSVLNVEDAALNTALNLYKTNNTTLRITGLQDQNNASIKMYSITGKEVLANHFIATRKTDIQLPTLATGVYFVNIVSENVKLTKKIIIE